MLVPPLPERCSPCVRFVIRRRGRIRIRSSRPRMALSSSVVNCLVGFVGHRNLLSDLWVQSVSPVLASIRSGPGYTCSSESSSTNGESSIGIVMFSAWPS